MKTLFSLILSVGMLTQSHAQCNATIQHMVTPFGSMFLVGNFNGDTTNTTYLWNICAVDTAGPMVGIALPPNVLCQVCLTIANDSVGCTNTICDTFTSAPTQPLGNCAAYANYSSIDSFFSFTVSALGAPPFLFEWDVNGQQVATTDSFSTVLTPANSPNGAYVCVSVTDSSGCVSTDCIVIGGGPVVGGFVPCQAYFIVFPDTGANSGGQPGNYYGLNFSSGSYDYVLWDFGDGTTSTDQFPVHTYAVPGNYILCLTVGSADTSCYDTYCDSSFYAFKTDENAMGQLTILAPTSINEVESELQVSVFPNPVSNELNLSVNVERAIILDLLGREVLTYNSTTNKLDVSPLPHGMYVLEGRVGGSSFRKTFVKAQ
jgi:hypothetical protein